MRNSSDYDIEYIKSDGCEIDDQPISCRFILLAMKLDFLTHVTAQQRFLMQETSSTSKRKHTSVADEDGGESSRTGGTVVTQKMSICYF